MKQKLIRIIAFATALFISLSACGNTESTTQKEVTPKEYETEVFSAFWEGASDFFGVEYNNYKSAHTAYSYIQDFETTDGYISHYYLIETAFETENIFGEEILHPVTARCYYVPDYSSTVYTTYMTLDGEKVFFDEETEDWLMGLSSSSNIDDNNNANLQNNSEPNQNQKQNDKSDNYYYEDTSDYAEEYDEYNEYDDGPAENLWPGASQIEDIPARDNIYILTEEELSDWSTEEESNSLDGWVTELSPEFLSELEESSEY